MATKTMPPRINGKAPNGVSDKAKRQADETLKQLIDERNNIRFSDIPSQINIPVYGIGSEEAQDVELDLMELMDDPTELCTLLENEKANRSTWVTTALAYVKQKKLDVAVEILTTGMAAADREQKPQDKITLIGALCWIYLAKMRDAPRIAPDGTAPGEVKTKEHYLRLVTQQLNEGTKLDASYAPLHMARGTLCVLRASLLAPVKTPGSTIDPQKVEILRQALGAFNNCIKTSNQKNMFAFMGKARVLYALGNYEEALANYQVVLAKLPQCINPDPRIGIGACLWMLGHKEEAKKAWERALVLNSDSVSANMLLALYNLQISSHLSSTSKEFLELYKKAMTEYTQKAYKIDKKNALANSTFAPFFLGKKPEDAAKLAKNAIHNTDVNAIASDSWYTLAKKEHYDGNLEKALEYYKRSDDARGGENRGYLPAKFGLAQISAMKNDLGEAKFRLEKILQLSKSNVAAQTLLGTVYADEVARSQYSTPVEDKSAEMKKAVTLLEAVRASWKSKIKTVKPDPAVLLNLARLYEIDHPDKSLICLQQIAQLQYEALAEKPATPEEEQQVKQEILKSLPPQVLNNMGALFYKSERFVEAKDHFQFALDSCIAAEKRGETMDIDALLTTISYNLGRALEAGGLTDDAITVYNGVLQRHSDYVDARLRLAYISLKRSPGSEGPRAVSKLHQEFGANLEVRALYGWYLGKVQQRQKISADKINENPEFRLYKHTLQNYDKHDRYALIGMGNIYLQTAREMPRQTDSEKAKRSTYYSKACEFFEKALQLDSRNAYAAQGVAIALIEDRKDYKNALTILSQVRETLKESIVFVNLGHLFAELRNWNKSIESYEYALEKSGGKDVTVIACLGRTWLNRGRHEKKLECYKNALMYAEKALSLKPNDIIHQFNVAFTQLQLAQILNTLPETGRKLSECLAAAEGLEAAIVSLDKIATQPHPPYSKSSIEGRAAMARNTMRKQLERTITSQRSYEEAEAEKVRKALALRAAELERRERVQREAEEREAQRKRLIAEERAKIAAADREMAERRAREAEEREEAEWTQDEETGERVKRTKKKRAPRKKREGSESGSEDDKPKRRRAKKKADSGDEADQPAKKRRLTKKGGKAVSKKGDANFKSAEVVVDSDEDAEGAGGESDAGRDVRAASVMSQLAINSDDEDEVIAKPTARRDRRRNVMSDDEDEDEEMGDADAPSTQVPAESVESPSQDVDAATTPAGGDFAPVTSTNVRSPSPTGGADEKVERGTEDVQDGGVTTTGLAIGEVNATSPARDRVAGEIPEDEPMGDADAMDGGDDAEEKEGQVDR